MSMTIDYNDGKWHGWNGGECPVHPETVVEVSYDNNLDIDKACKYSWLHDGQSDDIIVFRVIKPYVAQVEYEGKCWAYHYTNLEPSLASHNAGGTCQLGTWTAIHENGKLKSFTWSADE
jgi:hypothetical protein